MTAGGPEQYRIGDFPTYCPACGGSYWGTSHDCPSLTYVPFPPAPASPVPTYTYTFHTIDPELAKTLHRLADALEALLARYDGEDEGER